MLNRPELLTPIIAPYLTQTSKWTFTSQLLRIISSAFFILLITKYLGAEEISLWYLALAIGASSTIIEGGLSGVLTRNLTYDENADYFGPQIFKIYLNKFGLVFLLIITFYLFIFFSLSFFYMGADFNLWFALMVLGGFCSILVNNFLTSFLVSSGNIWKMHRSAVLQSLVVIILCIPMISTYGVSGVACTFLLSNLSAVLSSFASILCLKNPTNLENHVLSVSGTTVAVETVKSVPGIISFHVLSNVSLILFSPLLGVDEFASYAITMQYFNIILSFLNAYYIVTVRQFTVLMSRNEISEGILIFKRTVLRMTIIFIVSGIFGHTALSMVLHFFESDVNLLSGSSLYLLLLLLIIEFNFGCMSQMLLALKIFTGNYLIFFTSIIYALSLWFVIEANLVELMFMRLTIFLFIYFLPIMFIYIRLQLLIRPAP